MNKEIKKILYRFLQDGISSDNASQQILDLFKVRISELKKEIEVDDKLLADYRRVLDAIPECPVHGHCIPHAIDWIEEMKEPKYTESDMNRYIIKLEEGEINIIKDAIKRHKYDLLSNFKGEGFLATSSRKYIETKVDIITNKLNKQL